MGFFKGLIVDALGRRGDDFNWRRSTDVVPIESVRNVLILLNNDKIGDAVIYSTLVDAFAKARPDLPIAVGATAAYADFWRAHPHVQEVVLLPSSAKRGRSTLRRVVQSGRAARSLRGRFDVVVTFESYALPDHFLFLRRLSPRVLIGFNKHPYRLFHHSLEERRHGVYAQAIARRVEAIMEVFGVEVRVDSLQGHVPFGPEESTQARAMVERLSTPGRRLLLHPYGDGPTRIFSPDSVLRAVRALRSAGHAGPIFVDVPAGREEGYEAALRDGAALEGVALVPPMPGLFALFALVAEMDVVVALDTSVGHIAAALRKPQLAVFTSETNLHRVWRPLNELCVTVRGGSPETVNAMDWERFEAAARETLALAASLPHPYSREP